MKQLIQLVIFIFIFSFSFGQVTQDDYLSYRNKRLSGAICRIDSLQLVQTIGIAHEFGLNCNDKNLHDIYKDISVCHYRLYLNYKVEGSLDSSIKYYKKVVSLDTLDNTSIWNLSAILYQKKEFNECLKYLKMYHSKFKRKSYPSRKMYNALLNECYKNVG